MKNALILTLAFAAATFAQAPNSLAAKNPPIAPQTDEVKKLGSVTWDLDAHKLVWLVQKGTMVDGKFKATSEQRYEISPDEATMQVAAEKRGFDGQEAVSLGHLLDVLSVYCAESVVWWDQGEGDPVDNSVPSKPSPKKAAPSSSPSKEDKPVRVASPQSPASPAIVKTVAVAEQ